MMVTIALCDDDESVLAELSSLLERYRSDNNLELQYTAYQSPLDLLRETEKGTRYDIMFLDVIMPGENGIETAEEIRNYDKNVKIIFLTSSAEFAVQSYGVGAYYYQLKPITEDSFFHLLDSVLDTFRREQSSSIIIRGKDGITRIELDKLEYCEVMGKKLYFHLVTGRTYETTGNMEEVSRKLAEQGGFFRVHRSFTVNLDCIVSVTGRSITMSSNAEIPLPRGKFTLVKDAFLSRAFKEGWTADE